MITCLTRACPSSARGTGPESKKYAGSLMRQAMLKSRIKTAKQNLSGYLIVFPSRPDAYCNFTDFNKSAFIYFPDRTKCFSLNEVMAAFFLAGVVGCKTMGYEIPIFILNHNLLKHTSHLNSVAPGQVNSLYLLWQVLHISKKRSPDSDSSLSIWDITQ